MTQKISIELVFAAPDSQVLLELSLPTESTVASAIAASGLAEHYPDYAVFELPAGIWGRRVSAEETLKEGDRVEIYRELLIDPMEARRLKASAPSPDHHEPR